jgi:hypothetical protein
VVHWIGPSALKYRFALNPGRWTGLGWIAPLALLPVRPALFGPSVCKILCGTLTGNAGKDEGYGCWRCCQLSRVIRTVREKACVDLEGWLTGFE